MLINLSNHPSQYWDKKQIEASQGFGKLIDMPFPLIKPDASDDELEELSKEYVKNIVSLGNPKSITVHIMGEMTFTFLVVTRLKQLGIRCLASTTERKTTYNENGVKMSEFSFVRFREY